ncbi:MAG: zinc ribbon domain-containing protein [Promethearchaeota archaeon]|nr:MAG: zinc ribbon domain-containing protein [Candidatus Lokiarchaeota archaeon]
MHTIGILLILFIIPIVNIIAILMWLIYVIIILGIIKRINLKLNNENLKKFRSYYILSFIIIIIGVIIIFILAISFIGAIMRADPRNANRLINAFSLSTSIIGGIIGIIVGILQYLTWKNLNLFFEQNRSMFPDYISAAAINGSKKLTNAMLLGLIGSIIGVFLGIVGFIIGIIVWILCIIGYFKLGNLRNLTISGTPISKSTVQPAPAPIEAPTTSITKKFCPNCGSPITGTEKYCSACGSEL